MSDGQELDSICIIGVNHRVVYGLNEDQNLARSDATDTRCLSVGNGRK